MTQQRILLLLGGVAAAVALFLIVRPADDEEEAARPTTSTPTTTSTRTEADVPESAPAPIFGIRVRDGAPVGGIVRPQVAKGDRVRIVVRADVADHVHLHGYDLMRDVRPGAPAQFAFTADLVGVFELELEERSLLLAELEVTP